MTPTNEALAGLTAETDLLAAHASIQLYPHFLLRSSGIACGLVECLRSPGALEAVEQLIAQQRALQSEREHFLQWLWPRAMDQARAHASRRDVLLRSLHRIKHTVKRRRPLAGDDVAVWNECGEPAWAVCWNDRLERVRHAEARSRAEYDEARSRGRRALHEIFQDQRLQEAVFLSNPGFFEHAFRRWAESPFQVDPDRKTREYEATAHRYLRRLATKCEATSFFGPTLFARFDPAQRESMLIGAPSPEWTFVEASAGVVSACARLSSARLPLERIRARRDPLFQEQPDGRVVCVLDGRSHTPNPGALQLWRQVDGERELGDIADSLGIPREHLGALVAELGPLLIAWHEVPATAQRPLEYLAQRETAGGPARQLLEIRDRFAHTAWPLRREYFAQAESLCRSLGIEPRRGHGAHYADRTVFREDRASPFNNALSLGRPAVAGVLHALECVLPLCLVGALLVREDARESLRAVLQGEPTPLIALARRHVANVGWRAERLREAFGDLVRERAAGGPVARLSRAELVEWLLPFWDLVPAEGTAGCLPGPDLMAAGRDLDTARWILAELHDDCSAVFGGNFMPFHADPDGLWADFQDEVVQLVDVSRMATVISRRRNKHITPELPGLAIELSGRSSKPGVETAPIAAVTVDADGAHVRVGTRTYQLYPGDLSSPLHRALALPCVVPFHADLGAFTPRVEIEGVVYQRMRWRLELPAGASGFERWQLVHAMRVRHGLPERVYLRHPKEPKPLYLDFADPAAVNDLGRLDAGVVSMTEMLPGPDELWWRPGGQAQCSELRLGTLVRYDKRASCSGGR